MAENRHKREQAAITSERTSVGFLVLWELWCLKAENRQVFPLSEMQKHFQCSKSQNAKVWSNLELGLAKELC